MIQFYFSHLLYKFMTLFLSSRIVTGLGHSPPQTNYLSPFCCKHLHISPLSVALNNTSGSMFMNRVIHSLILILTRSTQRTQTSLAEADHYSHIAHCKNVEPWWWKTTLHQKRSFGSLPASRSGYATTIMVFFCSFTHLRIPRSPPKFNQFFIVLPRTPP